MTSAPAVKALICPNCGAPVEIRAAGYTVSFVCGHCGTTLDAIDPELKPIAAAQKAFKKPEIALGTRAMLRGGEWEAIGYVERTDGETPWAEYLLFSPYLGYRFLVDAGSRWSLGTVLDRVPERRVGDRVWLDRKSYGRASEENYVARVTFVVGEFYWRVAVGETVRVTEFERSGALLSCEANDAERTWTRLDILKPGEAEAAFGIPPREEEEDDDSDDPLRPSPYAGRLWSWGAIALFAIGFLVLSTWSARPKQQLFFAQLSAIPDAPEKTAVLGQVTIDQTEPVTITGSADNLDNEWIDVDYSLVNRKTQESYDAYATLEHYHGTDSDGAWQEGSPVGIVKLSSVPPGQYDLVADISAHRWAASGPYGNLSASAQDATATLPITVWVDRGGSFSGNFWTALLLILAWPSVLAYLHYAHEKRRQLAYNR